MLKSDKCLELYYVQLGRHLELNFGIVLFGFAKSA